MTTESSSPTPRSIAVGCPTASRAEIGRIFKDLGNTGTWSGDENAVGGYKCAACGCDMTLGQRQSALCDVRQEIETMCYECAAANTDIRSVRTVVLDEGVG